MKLFAAHPARKRIDVFNYDAPSLHFDVLQRSSENVSQASVLRGDRHGLAGAACSGSRCHEKSA